MMENTSTEFSAVKNFNFKNPGWQTAVILKSNYCVIYHDDAEMGLLSASVVCQLGFLKLIFLIAGMDDWIKFRNLT